MIIIAAAFALRHFSFLINFYNNIIFTFLKKKCCTWNNRNCESDRWYLSWYLQKHWKLGNFVWPVLCNINSHFSHFQLCHCIIDVSHCLPTHQNNYSPFETCSLCFDVWWLCMLLYPFWLSNQFDGDGSWEVQFHGLRQVWSPFSNHLGNSHCYFILFSLPLKKKISCYKLWIKFFLFCLPFFSYIFWPILYCKIRVNFLVILAEKDFKILNKQNTISPFQIKINKKKWRM